VGRAGSLQELVRRAAEELRTLFGHRCAAVLLWDMREGEFRGAFAPPAEAGPTEEVSIPAGQEPDLERAIRAAAPTGAPVHLRDFQGTDDGPLLERGCGAGRLVPLIIEDQAQGLVLWGGSGAQVFQVGVPAQRVMVFKGMLAGHLNT